MLIKVGFLLLTIHDGSFYEGSHPVFLFGAECHYFRIDPTQWRERLLQVRAAGCNLVSTYVPWLWHEQEEDRTDFTGVTHPRRNLVAYLELCRELGFYVIVRPGPYVMSELRREGIPAWVLDHYPEVIAQRNDGEPHPTRVVSYLHPTFMRLAESWYRAVIGAMKPFMADQGGPIVLVQLDNEIGMLHWVTNGADFHPLTLARFEAYARKTSLARVPLSLATGGQDTGNLVAVDSLSKQQAELREHFLWMEFCREEIAEYVSFLEGTAARAGVTVPFLINVHGFKDFSVYSRGTEYPIGASQLRTAARRTGALVAGDFYPGHITYDNFHDVIISTLVTAALSSPEQPIFSAEFQSGRLSDRPTVSGQDLDLLTRLCVAHGMNALNYYMFCAGDNPEDIGLFGTRHEWQAPIASDGTLRPSYAAAAHLGQMLSGVGRDLCSAPKVIDTHVAFYSPYYMTETAFSQSEAENTLVAGFAFQREQYHFDGIWRLLTAANISFSVLDLYEQPHIDPVLIPSLWVATTTLLDAATQQVLANYVADGGTLIIGPQLPQFDLDGSACRILADAMDVTTEEQKTGYRTVHIADLSSIFCRQHLVISNSGLHEVWGYEEENPSAVVASLHRFGKGSTLLLGVGLTHEYEYQVEVIRTIAARLGIHPQTQCSHPRALATLRQGRRGSFVSLINASDDDLLTTVTTLGRRAFGGRDILVPARSGALLPLQYRVSEALQIEYSTAEVTVEMVSDTTVDLLLSIHGEQAVMALSPGWTVTKSTAGYWFDETENCLHIRVEPRDRGQASDVRVSLGKNPIV